VRSANGWPESGSTEQKGYEPGFGQERRRGGAGANSLDHTVYRHKRELLMLNIVCNKLFQSFLHQSRATYRPSV
jgi:hypothetical protein